TLEIFGVFPMQNSLSSTTAETLESDIDGDAGMPPNATKGNNRAYIFNV
ncbi:unnamed protein product, partial [Rotaria socialis]